jgi:hypothetical protein
MRGSLILIVLVLVVAGLWLVTTQLDAPPPSTASPTIDPSPKPAASVRHEVAVSPPAINSPADRESEALEQRRLVESKQMDWPEKARVRGAMPNCGDMGIDALRAALRKALAVPDGIDPFAAAMPTPKELVKNRAINPSGQPLSAADATALSDLLTEYGPRLRKARLDRHLASRLAMIEAVEKHDFVEKPNGSDPDDIWRKTMTSAQSDFAGNQSDFNCTEIPGAHLGHNRIVILRRDRYPEYFTAVDREKMLRVEMDLAVQSIFVSSRSRR